MKMNQKGKMWHLMCSLRLCSLKLHWSTFLFPRLTLSLLWSGQGQRMFTKVSRTWRFQTPQVLFGTGSRTGLRDGRVSIVDSCCKIGTVKMCEGIMRERYHPTTANIRAYICSLHIMTFSSLLMFLP